MVSPKTIASEDRKRRPKGSGKHPITPLRLAPELVAAIDKHAKEAGTTRTGLIRQFIEAGLKRPPKVKRG